MEKPDGRHCPVQSRRRERCRMCQRIRRLLVSTCFSTDVPIDFGATENLMRRSIRSLGRPTRKTVRLSLISRLPFSVAQTFAFATARHPPYLLGFARCETV